MLEWLTAWKLALLAVLPFLRSEGMLRTWAAMMGGSLATFTFHSPESWFIIDAISAAIVLRPLAGLMQKAIGICFVGMMFFSLGFIIGGQADPALYRMALTGAGWVQWALLLGWTIHDVLGPYISRHRAGHHPRPSASRFP